MALLAQLFPAVVCTAARYVPVKFMVTMLRLTNRVENGFDATKVVISTLKKDLARDSQKKNLDHVLQALLDEDLSQMQDEFAFTLEVMQRAVSVYGPYKARQ
ncbi:hypothetical protein EVAR_62681_1 [Eumeta japonica]|uniref:Uncharacterized protein n=1 Tax=Eumeta variegata TaxID=151549 RepID=A0A4C1ZZ84_EUMVA|nr:hypothetical protein EVAR_62681_1 [Eumeta japonica]